MMHDDASCFFEAGESLDDSFTSILCPIRPAECLDDPLEDDQDEVEYERMMTGAKDDDEVEETQVEEAKIGKVARSPYAPTEQER